jgi:caffeoyl-CoA O-methyltransferase
MSSHPVPEAIESFATSLGPPADAVIAAMDRRADRDDFPTVGQAVGGWLATLTALVDAERVFEFGSGFGYSAYWVARALPEDGEVILTEIDREELDAATEYFARGDLEDRARFEHGDAIDTIEDYEGPFDLVLIDNEKDRYREAFEAVREKVSHGGLVLADNAMTAGPYVDFEAVAALVSGGSAPEASDESRGVADYLRAVREDADFETTLLPLGEGVAVSRRR